MTLMPVMAWAGVIVTDSVEATGRMTVRPGMEPSLDTEAKVMPTPPDAPSSGPYDWRDLARSRRLEVTDTNVRYPKFIDFCLRVYRWAEKTFNTYAPEYVVGTGKHGKVRFVSDNWTDMYYFRFEDGNPLLMASHMYSNIGIQVNYSILGISFSFEPATVFNGEASKHKKMGFSFSSARLFAEAYYWKNTGGTVIRKYGEENKTGLSHIPFDGLKFRAYGVAGLYFFNYSKFSYPAAYNLSNYQLKSAGSWIVGAHGTFYYCGFDFDKLSEEVKEASSIPVNYYTLNYNSVNILGGYSYNWVMNRHFLFNITALPGLGVTFSFTNSSPGHRELLSLAVKSQMSFTYTNRQFFMTANAGLTGNYFLTRSIGFISGIFNAQLSTGIRF